MQILKGEREAKKGLGSLTRIHGLQEGRGAVWVLEFYWESKSMSGVDAEMYRGQK